MEDLTTIRPKLLHDTAFFLTDRGLLFLREQESFLIKNKAAIRWFSRFGPYLDGGHTLAELCEGFEPERFANIATLVGTLLQKGVLKNIQTEPAFLLPEAVRQRFASQIECIAHHSDTPQRCFQAFRQSHVLLVGTGEMLFTLARSLLHNGLQELTLASLDNTQECERRLATDLQDMRQSGVECALTSMTYSALQHSQDMRAYDLVTCCAESDGLGQIAKLNTFCLEADVPFLPAVTLGGLALLGPLVHSTSGPCWLCALLRFSSNAESTYSAALWQAMQCGQSFAGTGTRLFTPPARMIGNGLGFEIFKILTKILPSEVENGALVQNLETLESGRNTLMRHPSCPACSQAKNISARQRLQAIVTGQRDCHLASEELSARAQLLIDPLLGICSRFADDDLTQMPLHQTKLLLGSPTSPLEQRLDVRAYSMNHLREARQLACAEALKRYARALPDKKNLIFANRDEIEKYGEQVIEAHQLSTWSGGHTTAQNNCTVWQPAFAYFAQTCCVVPAAAIYPASSLNRQGMIERNTAGLAIGQTFQETLADGMLSALAFIHLRDLLSDQARVIQRDPATLEVNDADLHFLLKSLDHLEQRYTVLEVVHPSPLHVVIVQSADMPKIGSLYTIGWGLSGSTALKKALLELLGKLQTLQVDGEIVDTSCAFFPAFSSCNAFVCADPTASRFLDSEATLAQIEDYLRSQPYEVLFVDTTPLDIYEHATYISGSVLIARIDRETTVDLS